MGGRIAPGSLLIHDLERAHGASCLLMFTKKWSE